MQMTSTERVRQITRRDVLRRAGLIAGGAMVVPFVPVPSWASHAGLFQAQTPAAAPTDPVAAFRTQMGAVPIEATKLTDSLTMLSGPGGNVLVINGKDGKVVVDSFVQPAFANLKKLLDGMGSTPVKTLIDTHWHIDHADNNENFRTAGAAVVAHENTKTRLSQSHDLLGMHFPPSPAAALPTETFKDRKTIDVSGERLEIAYVPPAHTDTDVSIHCRKANVLHLGDLFFNGVYPFIDASTGGHINGMIAAADAALKHVDTSTKIVPGHGPLGDRAALSKYRDVLVTVRDRVQKLKAAGRSAADVIAANPTADLDPVWGKGFMQPKDFLGIVYGTLK
jgi:glyoxylase-like metal-dependent hydrolase (beta-lactamase superfamily II)